MAKFARRLAEGNPAYGQVVEVLNGKVEEIQLSEKVRVAGLLMGRCARVGETRGVMPAALGSLLHREVG